MFRNTLTSLVLVVLMAGTTALGQEFPVVRTLPATFAGMPPTVASIDDVDGDGIDDVILAYARRSTNIPPGEIELVSGATGQVIRPILKPVDATRLFGAVVLDVGALSCHKYRLSSRATLAMIKHLRSA